MIRQLLKQNKKRKIQLLVKAPVRICDIGGWIDTWFSAHGKVFNITVWSKNFGSIEETYSGITTYADIKLARKKKGTFQLDAPDIKRKYIFSTDHSDWDKSDLLQAALSAVGLPEGIDAKMALSSNVIPRGSSVGSSAAVSVGLVATLEKIKRGEIDPNWIARKTHEIETEIMGIQCGVQDQASIASASGAAIIDIYHYPNFNVLPCSLTESTIKDLEDRLLTLVYGAEHSSSEVHKLVIKRLEKKGRLAPELEYLRLLPEEARYCVLDGDMECLGQVMIRNTEGQKNLHPALVSKTCQKLIDVAKKEKAYGWKVNGAGGPQGGSLTILCGQKSKSEVGQIFQKKFPNMVILEHKIANNGLQIEIK